jgi:hypothetical protein
MTRPGKNDNGVDLLDHNQGTNDLCVTRNRGVQGVAMQVNASEILGWIGAVEMEGSRLEIAEKVSKEVFISSQASPTVYCARRLCHLEHGARSCYLHDHL